MSSARSQYYGPKSAHKSRPPVKREASPDDSILQESPTKKHRNLSRREASPDDAPPLGFAPSATPGKVSRRLSFGNSDELPESTYALGTPGVSSFGRTIKPSHKAAELLGIKREPASDNVILQGLNALFEESTNIVTPKKDKGRAKKNDTRLKSPIEISDDDDLPASPFEGYTPKSRQKAPVLNRVHTVVGSPIVISDDSDEDKLIHPQDGGFTSKPASDAALSGDETISESDPYYDERAVTDPDFAQEPSDVHHTQEIPDDVIEAQIQALRNMQAKQHSQRGRSATVSTPSRRPIKDLRSELPSSKGYWTSERGVVSPATPNPSHSGQHQSPAPPPTSSPALPRDKGKRRATSPENTKHPRSGQQQSAAPPPTPSPAVPRAKVNHGADGRTHTAKSGHESEEWESITNPPNADNDGSEVEDAADNNEAEEAAVVDDTVCEFLNTGGASLGEGRFLNMDIVSRFAPEAYTPALAAMRFKKIGPFVNLVSHGFTGDITSQGRIIFKSSNKNVVGIMVGGLTNSNIVDPHVLTNRTTGISSSYKRVAIAPTEEYLYGFRQFVRSAFGEALLRTFMSTNADLSFSTKKEGTAASTVPDKNSMFYPPKNANPKLWYSANFPNCLEYEDEIKIYDCRDQDFMFDEASFRRLKSIPLYSPSAQFRNTPRELPQNAIVAIAFTMSTWTAHVTKAKNLSLNIQFGLLLGQLDAAHA